MHRLGDVVDVRLVEAAPVAGALRFELLSQGHVPSRGRRREPPRHLSVTPGKTSSKIPAGRNPRKKVRKPGKSKPGKSARGKSWKP
jgi:ribonuclease R